MSSDPRDSRALVQRGLSVVRGSEAPLVTRAKAFMRRITVQQQTKTALAENRLGEAIEQNLNLKLRIGLAQAALDNIDQLVARERHRVELDLRALDIAEDDLIGEAEVRQAQRALDRADLALRTLRAERQLARERAEPQEDKRVSFAQRANAEIARINGDFDALIETFKAQARGREDAQEELGQLIAQVEIARREKVHAIMDSV